MIHVTILKGKIKDEVLIPRIPMKATDMRFELKQKLISNSCCICNED